VLLFEAHGRIAYRYGFRKAFLMKDQLLALELGVALPSARSCFWASLQVLVNNHNASRFL